MSGQKISLKRLLLIVIGTPLVVLAALFLAGVAYSLASNMNREKPARKYPSPYSPLHLPRDHAAHGAFRAEWWTYAGYLESTDGHRFFFRFHFAKNLPKRDWCHLLFGRQKEPAFIYSAHLTLIDVEKGRQVVFERLSLPNRQNRASANGRQFALKFDNWQALAEKIGQRLSLAEGDSALELTLITDKPAVLHGQSGYLWLGNDGRPTYLISHSRLHAKGELIFQGQSFQVSGAAWLDHEFTSYRPPPHTTGCDRFNIQLNNNHELALFLFLRRDGGYCSDCPASLIQPDGSVVSVHPERFHVTTTQRWDSPRNGVNFPTAWKLEIEYNRTQLTIRRQVADGELLLHNDSTLLWAGSCLVQGKWNGSPVKGRAFAELAVYREAVDKRF